MHQPRKHLPCAEAAAPQVFWVAETLDKTEQIKVLWIWGGPLDARRKGNVET